MATKIKGLGTLLQVQISGVYTTIAQRASIDPPSVDIDMKETGDLDDTFVTRLPTLPDPGQLGLQVWLDPNDATHSYLAVSNANASSTPENFKLIFPSSPTRTRTFSGYVQSYKEGGVEPKGYLIADIKVQLSGPIVRS
jgi:hypothetical protein